MEKYAEGVKFLEDLVKPEGVKDSIEKFTIDKTKVRKFYKDKGIDEKTLKKVADVNDELINTTLALATKKLKEAGDDVQKVRVKTVTDFARYDTVVDRIMRQGRNPQTGDKIDIPGSAAIKVTVKPQIDKYLLGQCKDQIKKLVKI